MVQMARLVVEARVYLSPVLNPIPLPWPFQLIAMKTWAILSTTSALMGCVSPSHFLKEKSLTAATAPKRQKECRHDGLSFAQRRDRERYVQETDRSDCKSEEIRRIVRDERAKDPLITVSGLEKALEDHFQRGFSHQYVSKIADKVAREGLIEIDRTQIEDRMAFIRENYRMMREISRSPASATPGNDNAPQVRRPCVLNCASR
jgi:hypothetical protein